MFLQDVTVLNICNMYLYRMKQLFARGGFVELYTRPAKFLEQLHKYPRKLGVSFPLPRVRTFLFSSSIIQILFILRGPVSLRPSNSTF